MPTDVGRKELAGKVRAAYSELERNSWVTESPVLCQELAQKVNWVETAAAYNVYQNMKRFIDRWVDGIFVKTTETGQEEVHREDKGSEKKQGEPTEQGRENEKGDDQEVAEALKRELEADASEEDKSIRKIDPDPDSDSEEKTREHKEE